MLFYMLKHIMVFVKDVNVKRSAQSNKFASFNFSYTVTSYFLSEWYFMETESLTDRYLPKGF